MFLVWMPGTWGEQMFPGHLFSVLATGVVGGCPRWPVSGGIAWGSSSMFSFGKRGMVRVEGSASRTIGDQGTTDPGGGERVSGRGWPVRHEHGPSWASNMQAFPPLGSHPTEIHEQDNRELSVLARSVLGRRNPIVPDSLIGMGGGSPSEVPPVSGARRSGRGMRPAGGNSRSPKKLNVMYTSEVENMDSLDSFPEGLVVKRNARAVSLSDDVEVFPPEAVPSGGPPIEEGPESYRNHGPPLEMAGGYADERMVWG